MFSQLRSHLPAWRRAIRRRRRSLAVLACALLAVMLLPGMYPAGSRSTSVVVAASDLPAGTVLNNEHLRVEQVAASLVPRDAAQDPAALIGRESIVAVPAGTVLLSALLAHTADPSIPAGRALMAVATPPELSAHLRPGARVEILASGAEPGSPIRIPAEVTEVLRPGDSAVPEFAATGAGEGDGPGIVVMVQRERSGDLAQAVAEGWFTVSVIG